MQRQKRNFSARRRGAEEEIKGALVKKVQLRGARRSMSGGVLLYVDAKSDERNEVDALFHHRALGALPRASHPLEPLQAPAAQNAENAKGDGASEYLINEEQLIRFP